MSTENKEKEAEPITINLNTLESTEVRCPNELLFRDEFERLLGKIRRKAKENGRLLKEKEECGQKKKSELAEIRGVPTCFFIDGSRGSGKSTLLRAVSDALVKGKFFNDYEEKIGLYHLADIDPTELGKGENFFLYLMGRIYKILEDSYKERNRDDTDIEDIRSAMEDLRRMSGGLQVLMDSDKALKNHDNPDFFLEECIDKCADSMQLREKLCALLRRVAKIVGKEVFLVTIDDADLNFSKCEDVLEYVRKYMQTPRLIFLFAGDLQLYSHIVRSMHLKNFDNKLLSYDDSHKPHRNMMLDHLEDQYVQKLFPVDNRAQTQSLKTISEGSKKVFIQLDRSVEQKVSVRMYLREYLMGPMRIEEEAPLIDAILQLPLRSCLLLLQYLGKAPQTGTTADRQKYIWSGIQKVFLPSLVKHNIDYTQFGGENIALLQKTLFRYYSDAHFWNADLSLLPTESESSNKQASLYLSGVVSLSTQSLSAKLCYWCGCFPAWHAVRELYLKRYDSRPASDMVEACLKIGNGGAKSSWANLACSAVAPGMTAPLLYGLGTICILNDNREQEKESGTEHRLGMLSLMKEVLLPERDAELGIRLYAFALNSCLCRLDDSAGSHFYLSVYHLLMSIADWLDYAENALYHLATASRSMSAMAKKNAFKQAIRAKLSSNVITPHTLRLGGSERKNVKSGRLAHVYSGVSDSRLVEEMYTWLHENVGVKYVSTSGDFSRSWETFVARCRELTAAYTPEYVAEESCPKAGKILRGYMSAVERALSCCSDEGDCKLAHCITSFPLWRILVSSAQPYDSCRKKLDSACIGYFVNLTQKNKIARLQKEYKEKERIVTHYEEVEKEFAKRYEQTRHLLAELEQAYEEKKAEFSLRSSRAEAESQKVMALHETTSQLLLAEERVSRNVREKNRQYAKIEAQHQALEEKCRLVQSLLHKEIPDYGELSARMDRTEKLLSRAQKDATRRQYENALELMRDVKHLLEQAEAQGTVEKEKQDLETQKQASEAQCAECLAELEELRSGLRQAGHQRSLSQAQVSEAVARCESFRKSAFDAEVDCEIAKMKYERLKTEEADWQTKWGDAKAQLVQAHIACDNAAIACKQAIDPDKTE